LQPLLSPVSSNWGEVAATGKHAKSQNDPWSIDVKDESGVNLLPNVGKSSNSNAQPKKKAKFVKIKDDELVTTLKDGF
jgi:hypothetical protein